MSKYQYYFIIKYLNNVYVTTNCSYIDLNRDIKYNMVANKKNEVLYQIELILDGFVNILDNRSDLNNDEKTLDDNFYIYAGKNSTETTNYVKAICEKLKNEKCNIIGVEIHQKQTLNCVVFDMLENEILNNNIITL